MSSARLIRWSGLMLLLGGICLGAHYLLHPPLETTGYGLMPTFIPVHWIAGIGYLVIPLGLMGLCARQWDKLGTPGLSGFVITYVACILLTGFQFSASILVPFIALRGLTWVDFPGGELLASPVLQAFVGVIIVTHMLGIPLLAYSTLRARVLPRLGAWLVISTGPIGVVLIALFFLVSSSPTIQGIAQAIFGLVLGMGLAVWGWDLWSEQGDIAGHAKAVP